MINTDHDQRFGYKLCYVCKGAGKIHDNFTHKFYPCYQCNGSGEDKQETITTKTIEEPIWFTRMNEGHNVLSDSGGIS